MTEKLHCYALRRLEEIFSLSQLLAQFFPNPAQVMTGIYELLLNAVEHGNLGIGAEAKSRLVREGKWEAEVTRRLSLPHYANKEVKISVMEGNGECSLVIADEGRGFDWRRYLHQGSDPRNPNGRGLLIAFSAGFDRMSFNEAGNSVTCVAMKPQV